MKVLKSDKIEIPLVYLVTNREEIKKLPVGVPYIFGDADIEPYLVRLLEYEVLYLTALKSGYPFNFKQILRDNGYEDIEDFWYTTPAYLDYATAEGEFPVTDPCDELTSKTGKSAFKKFVKDSAAYVDIQKLKDLNVFPVWLDTIEKSIETNIHNFAVFNNNMYNKKLEGMFGSIDLTSPNRNLIIIDISGSIPKAVSATCLAMAKNLTETFYADLMITGSKTTLYHYENLTDLNISTIYDENGMDNDQAYFKKIVSSDVKHYKTAIVFGDNHSPCYPWRNSHNKGTKTISREDGKKLCRWKIDKLISFHTSSSYEIAGYADWFEPTQVEHISNWVQYLKK